MDHPSTNYSSIFGSLQVSQPHENKIVCVPCSSHHTLIQQADVEKKIKASCLPNILNVLLGPYEEIEDAVMDLLNTDFRLHTTQYPQKASRLFTGVIIHDKVVLFVVSAEVYARQATLDLHLESGVNSLPFSRCH